MELSPQPLPSCHMLNSRYTALFAGLQCTKSSQTPGMLSLPLTASELTNPYQLFKPHHSDHFLLKSLLTRRAQLKSIFYQLSHLVVQLAYDLFPLVCIAHSLIIGSYSCCVHSTQFTAEFIEDAY